MHRRETLPCKYDNENIVCYCNYSFIDLQFSFCAVNLVLFLYPYSTVDIGKDDSVNTAMLFLEGARESCNDNSAYIFLTMNESS